MSMTNSSIASTKSIAGIQEKDDARVIPMTRRPDGTYRKERKVRPGYTPPEDVAKYTNRVLDSVRPAAPSPSPLIAAANTAPKTKAQLKNDKRKVKRKEEQATLEVADDGGGVSANQTQKPKATTSDSAATSSTTTTAAAAAPAAVNTAESAMDPEKKLRALNKKLRQAEQLKGRQEKGEEMLPEQLDKISKMAELQVQIEQLSI